MHSKISPISKNDNHFNDVTCVTVSVNLFEYELFTSTTYKAQLRNSIIMDDFIHGCSEAQVTNTLLLSLHNNNWRKMCNWWSYFCE